MLFYHQEVGSSRGHRGQDVTFLYSGSRSLFYLPPTSSAVIDNTHAYMSHEQRAKRVTDRSRLGLLPVVAALLCFGLCSRAFAFFHARVRSFVHASEWRISLPRTLALIHFLGAWDGMGLDWNGLGGTGQVRDRATVALTLLGEADGDDEAAADAADALIDGGAVGGAEESKGDAPAPVGKPTT